MSDVDIVELETESAQLDAFPVLSELRDHLDEDSFLDYLEPMVKEGYRLFGAYDGDEIVAVAGVRIGTNFYDGRHAFVYDLVTTADRRSEGHGAALVEWVCEWADERDCKTVALESGLWRDDAHRFYERLDFEKYCYSFRRDLVDETE